MKKSKVLHNTTYFRLLGKTSGKSMTAVLWIFLMTILLGADIIFAIIIGNESGNMAAGITDSFSKNAIFITLLFILKIVCSCLATMIIARYKERVAYDIRRFTLSALMSADYKWISTRESGEILQRCGVNLNNAVLLITSDYPKIVLLFLQILVSFTVIAFIDWRIAIIYFISHPLIMLIQIKVSKPAQKGFGEAYAKKGEYMGRVQNALENSVLIKAYEYFENISSLLDTKYNQYAKKIKRTWVIGIPGMILGMILSLIPISLLVISSYFRISSGSLGVEKLVTILIIIAPLEIKMRSIFDSLLHIRQRNEAGKRILKIWDSPTEFKTDLKLLDKSKSEGILAFHNVSFRYDENEALKNISLTIKKGEHVVVLGESGSGKSTLFKLLMKLYEPNEGHITAWGIESSDWEINEYRKMFSYIPQEAYMFAGSLSYNLRHGKELATDTEMLEACRKANILKMVENLPEGLNTDAEEAGKRFSGGEKQRFTMARAFLRESEVLLMDEISSALDDVTANQILRMIDLNTKNMTVIQITHNINTIIKADKLIYLSEGSVKYVGKPEDFTRYKERMNNSFSIRR